MPSDHSLPTGPSDDRHLLRSIIEEATVAIFAKDREGRYVLINRHAAGLLGMETSEVVGKTDFDLFPQEIAERMWANDQRVLRGETVETEEQVDLGGRARTYYVSKVPLRDAEDRPYGLCGIGFDISYLREAQRALRESEERFRTMADSAPVLIWMFGRDHGGVFFNATWLRFRGRALEEELGGGWLEGVHPDDMTAIEECEAAFQERRRFRTQFRLLRHDGEHRWMLDTGVPRYDPDGEFAGFIGSCIDVTERIRLEETLRAQAEALAEADRRKDQFLAMLGHELRNPMAPLRHVIELFRSREDDLDDDLRQGVAVAERQLEQMRRIVDDLLDVARLTRGQIRLDSRPMPLRRAVETAVETVRPFIETRGIRLELTLPDPELRVDGDEARLAQVLANLLHNAAKYTPTAGAVSLVVGSDREWATVEVRDQGIGMTPEVISRAFDTFYQREPTLERTEGGLGLGLSVARDLVELHGGEIGAESAGPGTGSVFRVRLPRLAARDAVEESRTRSPPQAGSEPASSARCRVLVVDDNRDSADSLGTLLDLDGHRVETAYDGESALTAAAAFSPDVVLLDIGLPRIDGYEVARRLRRSHGEDLLILALTGYGQESARLRSREAGFDHHLLKPVDLAVLRSLLAEASAGCAEAELTPGE